MSAKKIRASDKTDQEAAAEELQRQIDEIVSGKAAPEPPRSLRDFIAEKSAKVGSGKPARRATKVSPAKKKSK